jgi:hypothetical protein
MVISICIIVLLGFVILIIVIIGKILVQKNIIIVKA